MGRKAHPPRLWLCPTRKQWVIRDGMKFVRLGTADEARANEALAGYVRKKPAADKATRLSRQGIVYVIGTGPYVKIGYTKNTVAERLKTLNVSMPEEPTVIAEIKGSRRDELALHHRFAASRLRGEWFRREGEIEAWIAAGCQRFCAEAVPEIASRFRAKYPNLSKYG